MRRIFPEFGLLLLLTFYISGLPTLLHHAAAHGGGPAGGGHEAVAVESACEGHPLLERGQPMPVPADSRPSVPPDDHRTTCAGWDFLAGLGTVVPDGAGEATGLTLVVEAGLPREERRVIRRAIALAAPRGPPAA